MSEPEQEALLTVCDAAELLVSTPPVQLAAALRAGGLDRAAEHIRFLGVAVTLARATATLESADRSKLARFTISPK